MARGLVEEMRAAGAQGMILWNVEGNGGPGMQYVGDPEMVEFICPEMDAVADAYFAIIRDAGFRTGICLRPSTLTIGRSKEGVYKYWHNLPRERDVVDALDDKIRYAKRRWGCTIFYIDTQQRHPLGGDGRGEGRLAAVPGQTAPLPRADERRAVGGPAAAAPGRAARARAHLRALLHGQRALRPDGHGLGRGLRARPRRSSASRGRRPSSA